jgi:3-oxoadipate enol-lactonase
VDAIQAGTVALADGSLFYEEAGSGIPVVFISGGSLLDLRGWDDQFTALRRGYRTIRYDVRGVGRSSRPAAPFSPLADLESLLDELTVERAVLVGHSFAGGVAIDFCLERPERVIALAVAAPALGGFAYSDAFEQRLLRVVSAYRTSGADGVVAAMLADPHLAPRHPRARERVGALIRDNIGVLEIDPRMSKVIDPPAIDRLEEVRRPLLVVAAEHDHPDNRAVCELLEARVANARQVELRGTGHLAHLDEPRTFTELLYEFILDVAPTRERGRSRGAAR